MPCLELTSDGICDGCDPGEKCSSLYVMRGVRGWTAWDGCTTGTLFDVLGMGGERDPFDMYGSLFIFGIIMYPE